MKKIMIMVCVMVMVFANGLTANAMTKKQMDIRVERYLTSEIEDFEEEVGDEAELIDYNYTELGDGIYDIVFRIEHESYSEVYFDIHVIYDAVESEAFGAYCTVDDVRYSMDELEDMYPDIEW